MDNRNRRWGRSKSDKGRTEKIGTAQFRELGDLMALLRAVGLFEQSTNPKKFCFKNGIRYKAMNEIHEMGIQLLKEMKQVFPDQVARKIPCGETQDNKNLKKCLSVNRL
ncbi:hypothetical protein CEXT_137321 [Caerostris extrusa]|uniref:LAGLIDADG homing endonuclease n=1 Tax=Caerostris extrusa TaxID=172846 RepID=A0AAV4X794_CAEEX|nr:hypothetical protein CEXT_137321 [Caerostris extrusa]